MRIILDNGAYSLRNMGDVAMLQIAANRLRSMVPDVELMILTSNPDLLRRYCPGAIPLSVKSRDFGYGSHCPGRSGWRETWARLKRRWRTIPVEARPFQDALEGATAVFLCGGGFLNDLNPYQTRPVLRMLTDAARRGKRTALFSQGLGPLESPELISLLSQTCQAGTRTALREGLYGPEILKRARAGPNQFELTGDDALEMAWQRGVAGEGKAIGFSVRQVAYSEIEENHLKIVAGALQQLVAKLGSEIVALPISFNGHERDHDAIARVSGLVVPEAGRDTPQNLIDAVADCRVLVTGTYHAAVFALARGIPCVCFYVSKYYRQKMEGLAAQFPGGCAVIDLNRPDSCERVVSSALSFCDRADGDLRSTLRNSAEGQVRQARKFYETAMGVSTSS